MMLRCATCLILLLSTMVVGQRRTQESNSMQPKQRAPHATSPCPSVFSYEGRAPDKNRWFGVILVSTEEPLKGIRLDVNLDRPAQLLGNWEGKVSSKDNIHYTVVNLNKKIVPGPPISVRIFVKFEETDTVPQVKSIRLNGKQICPAEPNLQVLPARPAHTSLENPGKETNYPVLLRSTTTPSDAEWITSEASQNIRLESPKDTLPWEPPAVKPTTDLPLPWDGTQKEVPRVSVNDPDILQPNEDTPMPNVGIPTLGKRPTSSQGGGNHMNHRCGTIHVQASPLVTRGQKTARGLWPWHAALYQSERTDLKYICGGSLISSSIVVTAAHCVTRATLGTTVDPETVVVYLGKHHLKMWSEGGVQDKQVSTIHVHPSYNSNDFRGDVAILKLSSPVKFSQFVQPVCLWNSRMIDLTAVEGKEGTVVGWGFDETGHVTEELMMAKMPVVSEVTCLRSYPEFFSKFSPNNTFCAGFRNGTSVCNGDSGGGMVFPTRDNDGSTVWHLRGLVSNSVSQENNRICNTRHYIVFTDVAKYLDWIQGFMT